MPVHIIYFRYCEIKTTSYGPYFQTVIPVSCGDWEEWWMVIWALCRSCGFACHQRVHKTFPDPHCIRSEDGIGVAWLGYFVVNLHIYSSLFYLATVQFRYVMAIEKVVWALRVIVVGLLVSRGCWKRFTTQNISAPKMGVVWLWHFLVNLHIYDSPFYIATAQPQCLIAIGRDGGLSTLS